MSASQQLMKSIELSAGKFLDQFNQLAKGEKEVQIEDVIKLPALKNHKSKYHKFARVTNVERSQTLDLLEFARLMVAVELFEDNKKNYLPCLFVLTDYDFDGFVTAQDIKHMIGAMKYDQQEGQAMYEFALSFGKKGMDLDDFAKLMSGESGLIYCKELPGKACGI